MRKKTGRQVGVREQETQQVRTLTCLLFCNASPIKSNRFDIALKTAFYAFETE